MSFDINKAMSIKLPSELPPEPTFDSQYRRAPNRGFDLSPAETVVAVKNSCLQALWRLQENQLSLSDPLEV